VGQVKGSSTITALASFNLPSQSVYRGVTFDANGHLFGTTSLGGANNQGRTGTDFPSKKQNRHRFPVEKTEPTPISDTDFPRDAHGRVKGPK
jgi:hypothetical protein